MKRYVGDFETATWLKDETWVWAWAVAEIGNEDNIKIDNNISSFFDFCQKENNPIIYFHNLKFDGAFIVSYLLENGFTPIKDKKERADKTFTSLISDMGIWYSLEIYFHVEKKRVKKVTIYDSLKIIPMPVVDIPKSFGIEEHKLEIDYNKPREKGHILTEEEKEYIKNDVVIVAKALKMLFDEKLKKMTTGSNALHNFKEMITKERFKHYFPELTPEADSDIRKAYKGRIYISKSSL